MMLLLLAAGPTQDDAGATPGCVEMSDSVRAMQRQAADEDNAAYAAAVKARGLTPFEPKVFSVEEEEYQATPQYRSGTQVGPKSRHGEIVDLVRQGVRHRVFVWVREYQLPLGRDAKGRVFVLEQRGRYPTVREVMICGCDDEQVRHMSPCPGCGGPRAPRRITYQAFEVPPRFQGDLLVTYEGSAVALSYQSGRCDRPMPP